MNYRQLQQQAKALRTQGLLAKEFKLNQSAKILKAAIESVTANTDTEMSLEVFTTKFNQLYKEITRKQEVEDGVVVVGVKSFRKEFIKRYGIEKKTFNAYFKKQCVFTTVELDTKIFQIVY